MEILIALLSGGLSGLLINYFSDVLPVSRKFSRPVCKNCNEPFSLFDYLFSIKCNICASRKSARSLIVIFLATIICTLLIYFPFANLDFWTTLPLLIFFGVIIVIDFEHRLVLIQTSIVGLILFLVYGFILHGLRSTLFGAGAGLLVMLTFYLFGIGLNKIVGVIKKKELTEVAFGFGDVWLGTILGLLTGWPGIIGAVLISLLASSAFSLIFLLVLTTINKYRAFSNTLPFTLFLILGAIAGFYL